MKEVFAKPAVGMLIERFIDGQLCLLMQERYKPTKPLESGMLEFPGGKIREGESVIDTIRREMVEETALALTHVDGLSVAKERAENYEVGAFRPFMVSENTHMYYPILQMCFRCKASGTCLEASDESRNLRWLSLGAIRHLLKEERENIYPMDRLILDEYLALYASSDLIIRPVLASDIDDLTVLFEQVIPHTYEKEGVGHLKDFIEEEIQSKKDMVRRSVSNEENYHFFLATFNDEVIACVSLTPANDIVVEALEVDIDHVLEIGSLFVKPNWQGARIGKALLNESLEALEKLNHTHYVLDSGYQHAQVVWQHLLGAPSKTLPDYWDKGVDHMIWYRPIR